MIKMLRLARSTRCLQKYARASKGFDIRSYAAAATTDEKRTMVASFSVCNTKRIYLSLNMPAVEKTDSDDGKTTCVFFNLPGVKRDDDPMVRARVEDGALLLQVRKYEESYSGGKVPKHVYSASMWLPRNNNTYSTSSIINTEMQDGLLKVTLPKLEYQKPTFFAPFKWRFVVRLFATIPSVVMMPFARPFMIYRYCPQEFDSFTIYRKATPGILHMNITPGLHKIDFNKRGKAGACVSLKMPGLKIEDVRSFLRHGTLFIQGKNKTAHYVTGIRLPEGYSRIVKTEMQDGMYKATIPFVYSRVPPWRRLISILLYGGRRSWP